MTSETWQSWAPASQWDSRLELGTWGHFIQYHRSVLLGYAAGFQQRVLSCRDSHNHLQS